MKVYIHTTQNGVMKIANNNITFWEEAKKMGTLASNQVNKIIRLLKLFGSFTDNKEQSMQARLFSLVN